MLRVMRWEWNGGGGERGESSDREVASERKCFLSLFQVLPLFFSFPWSVIAEQEQDSVFGVFF